jgi:hypothetical protein
MLAASIIKSADRLLLVKDDFDPNFLEWGLERVTLKDSMSFHPSYLQDGCFLVEFFIAHTDNVRFNGINQQFWWQYQRKEDIFTSTSQSKTHLFRPSATLEEYTRKDLLLPVRK